MVILLVYQKTIITYFKVSQLDQAGKAAKIERDSCLQCLSSESDFEHLNLPQSLDVLVKKFINTYSGDYITDTNGMNN